MNLIKAPRDFKLTRGKNITATPFYSYHFQLRYFISEETDGEAQSLKVLALPLPVMNSHICSLVSARLGQTYKPATITISRMRSYFVHLLGAC